MNVVIPRKTKLKHGGKDKSGAMWVWRLDLFLAFRIIFCNIWVDKMSFVPVCDCHSPPTAPATPTLQALVNELASVENWHLLGVKLGLQGHQLHEIERDYRGDNSHCKAETLYMWQRNAKNPSWEAIVEALCLMQEHVVADAIRRKYCSSSTTAGKQK